MSSLLPRPKLRLNRTTLMTVGFGAFLAGLGLARMHIFIPGILLIVLAVFLVLVVRKRRWAALVVVILFSLSAGLWRGAVYLQKLDPYQRLYKQKVVLLVTAKEDATYGKSGQLSFDVSNIRVTQPVTETLPGRIKVSGYGESMVYRGDVLRVEGKLWPTRGGRQAQMSFAVLSVQTRHKSPIDTLRREFAAGMQSALPEPLASFGLGILIGQRSTMPEDVAKQLSIVGLTHIVAVSGYNLTIIVDAIRRLMERLKGSKFQGTLLTVGLIGTFLLMTGFSPSIVRAAVVSGLGLWAWYYGRRVKPLLLISFAAALTAGWNPLYLWGDIGWYLSFLAFFGVLVIAPLIMRRLYGEREPGFIQAILIETTSAQIMALPFILYIFQEVSLVSILSNLLVVPLVPLAMLLALIAGLAGMLIPFISGWFAWPAWALLTYILDIANVLSHVPHALAKRSISLVGLLSIYAAVLSITFVLWKKIKPNHGMITDKKITS